MKTSENLRLIDYFYKSLLLFPLFLITGPFLPDLVATLISIIFIFYILSYKKFYLLDNKIIIFFLFFWLYISLRSLFTDEILFSLRSSFSYLRFIIFSAAIVFILNNKQEFSKNFFISLLLALGIFILASMFEFFSGYNIFLDEKPSYRLTGTFGDEQIVGSFLSRTYPVLIGLYYICFKKFDKMFFAIIFLCLFTTVISGERTSTFYVILSTTAIALSINFSLKKKFLCIFLILLVSTSTVLSFPKLKFKLVNQTLESFGIKALDTSGSEAYVSKKPSRGFYIFSQAHEAHYFSAFQMFKNNIIFGQGVKMYRKKCEDPKIFVNRMSCTTHPHNILFQILAETGIIGFIFYIIAFLYVLYNLFKNFIKNFLIFENKKFVNICFLICFMQNLLFILPSGNIFNNFLALQMFLPLGFYLYVTSLNEI